jgi:anti-sigma regulatory factor (Ser/Thr protein kinase)
MTSGTYADARWLCLPAVPESCGRCREFVRPVLEGWGVEDGLDDVLLLVSELCSNVVRHAGTPMVVGVARDPVAHMVRISVRDDAAGLPTVRSPADLEPSGRGMQIVQSVARRWGVQRLPVGKVVWFEVRVGSRRARAREDLGTVPPEWPSTGGSDVASHG